MRMYAVYLKLDGPYESAKARNMRVMKHVGEKTILNGRNDSESHADTRTEWNTPHSSYPEYDVTIVILGHCKCECERTRDEFEQYFR